MVLTEAIGMSENPLNNPINNVLASHADIVATSAGMIGTNKERGVVERTNAATTKATSNDSPPAVMAQPTLPERGILGAYEGTTNSSSSRSKAPIYTRDKRTKFTQRENKKWVRLATVVGYLIAVCIPAVALSIYYIGFWDPNYKKLYEASYQQQLKDMLKDASPPAATSPPQYCCPACSCPGSTGGGEGKPEQQQNRTARDLPRPSNNDDDKKNKDNDDRTTTVTNTQPPVILSSKHHYRPAEELSDGTVPRDTSAYYQHVVVGKNYAIYGAVQDDSSSEDMKRGSPTSPSPIEQHTGSTGPPPVQVVGEEVTESKTVSPPASLSPEGASRIIHRNARA